MKLINFKLQTLIENAKENSSSKNSLEEYLKAILEDESRNYFQKADYLGLSMQEVKLKIDDLSKSIKELQELKKSLTSSLDIVKELTANIFIDNGIDRIDGNIISSLTLSKESTKIEKKLEILDKEALMAKGFIKYSLDMEALQNAISSKDEYEKIKELVSFKDVTTKNLAKIKVNNKKRATNDSEFKSIESLEVDIDTKFVNPNVA